MIITTQQIKAGMQWATQERIDKFGPSLIATMAEFEINTPGRICAFLAQVAHESGSLKYVKEIWGPTKQQLKYERNLDHAWPPSVKDDVNRVSWNLGNNMPGDGVKFMGRGPIQITGRGNYLALSVYFQINLIAHPELLEIPEWACKSTGWFWKGRTLNKYADLDTIDSFEIITKKINGGLNGLEDRVRHWKSFKQILS